MKAVFIRQSLFKGKSEGLDSDMKKHVYKLIFLLAIPLLALNGCGGNGKNSRKNIYIPILADAEWLISDETFINGVQMAVNDVNGEYREKGFFAEAEIIDDKGLYEKGVEVAEKAKDDRVTAVFNLQDFDVSKTTADIISKSGKIVLFPYGAYDMLFSRGNPYLFCAYPSFSDLGKVMAAYAVKQGYKRIAVYHNGLESQEELVTAFELALMNTGTKVVDYVPSIASENDFDSIYARWQALDVDCVVISQYGVDRAFEILRMLRARDKDIAVLGEPVFNSVNALEVYGEIAEKMAVPSTLVLEDNERLKAFKTKYLKEYGKEADVWAVQGYDMVRLIVDTAARINSGDPEKIAKALHDKKGYQGIGRHIAFDGGGAMITDIDKLPMLICRNGKFE